MNLTQQREQLDLLQDMNKSYLDRLEGAPELEATIQSMEVAFRMQTEAPDVFDTRKESPETIAKYGRAASRRRASRRAGWSKKAFDLSR